MKFAANDKMSTSESPQLRQLMCELGNLSRPDGSATLSHGDTCVIASVYGPGEVRQNKEQLDKATVDIVYKPKSGLPGCAEKAYEKLICNTCDYAILTQFHPRSSINITIQELQNSGSLLAACMNCACLALLDASVSMNCTIAAVHCCIDEDGNVILDPVKKVESGCKSQLTFVFDSVDKNIVTVSAMGKFSREQYQKCLHVCREASQAIFDFYRETMKRKLSKIV